MLGAIKILIYLSRFAQRQASCAGIIYTETNNAKHFVQLLDTKQF